MRLVWQLYTVIFVKDLCVKTVMKTISQTNLKNRWKWSYFNFEDVPLNVKSILEMCKSYCEQCIISFCQQCVSCREHFGHELLTWWKKLKLQTNLYKEIFKHNRHLLYPKYQNITSALSPRFTKQVSMKTSRKWRRLF